MNYLNAIKYLILCIFFFTIAYSSLAQRKVGLTGGLSHSIISHGGEGVQYDLSTGFFVGYPFRVSGNKHQFVIQPDFSAYKLHNPEDGFVANFIGTNVAFKYSYIPKKWRFSAGVRSGFEGTLGVIGFVLEVDRKISNKLMLGINANAQATPGSYTESFAGIKLQLSYRL